MMRQRLSEPPAAAPLCQLDSDAWQQCHGREPEHGPPPGLGAAVACGAGRRPQPEAGPESTCVMGGLGPGDASAGLTDSESDRDLTQWKLWNQHTRLMPVNRKNGTSFA